MYLYKLLQVLRQSDAGGSWISFEVKRLLADWFHFPKDNLGIVIQATGPQDPYGRSLIVTDLDEENGSLVSRILHIKPNSYYL